MIDFSTLQGLTIPLVPAGYTRLKYIESTGKEYIDTGFIANQDTRVVLDAYNLSAGSSWAFGAWTGARSLQYAFSCYADYSFRYGANNVKLSTVPVGEFTVDFNKNAYNLNGVTGTFEEQEFTCEYTMYLFAINAKGSVSSGKFTGRIYSCKIYDNGTLVRDFIPCKNASGDIGLYDLVNSEFYTNSGSGAFVAGETVSGVVTQITDASGRVLWEATPAKEIAISITNKYVDDIIFITLGSDRNSARLTIKGVEYDGSTEQTIYVKSGTVIECYVADGDIGVDDDMVLIDGTGTYRHVAKTDCAIVLGYFAVSGTKTSMIEIKTQS